MKRFLRTKQRPTNDSPVPAAEGPPAADSEARSVESASHSSSRSKIARWSAALAVLLCLVSFHAPILRGLAGPLIADQQQAPWDHLWIQGDEYGPDGDRCYDRVAELYGTNRACRVVVEDPLPARIVRLGVVPTFSERSRQHLTDRGVPEEALRVVGGTADNQWQHAQVVAAWLAEHPQARVLLLRQRFESGVARRVLDCLLAPADAARVQVVGLPNREYDETNWWKSRTGIKALMRGWLRLAYTWRGESPAGCEPWDPDQYERELGEIAAAGSRGATDK